MNSKQTLVRACDKLFAVGSEGYNPGVVHALVCELADGLTGVHIGNNNGIGVVRRVHEHVLVCSDVAEIAPGLSRHARERRISEHETVPQAV